MTITSQVDLQDEDSKRTVSLTQRSMCDLHYIRRRGINTNTYTRLVRIDRPFL